MMSKELYEANKDNYINEMIKSPKIKKHNKTKSDKKLNSKRISLKFYKDEVEEECEIKINNPNTERRSRKTFNFTPIQKTKYNNEIISEQFNSRNLKSKNKFADNYSTIDA